jgi:hypothetical protein
MALPKIDTPIFDLELPLSKKQIKFRPFLVKEQRNLLLAMESDDKESIESNIRQILHNCTLTEGIDVDSLPITDIEYYFLQLRARSVGEIVENKYRCENEVEGKICNNSMELKFNLLDINVKFNEGVKDVIQLTDKISIKLNYPKFSLVRKTVDIDNATDMAFKMIVDSVEYIFDGQQYYYARETDPAELTQFIESLNQEQFNKIENFFENLPKLNKTMNLTCNKCGFNHTIDVEGLESFFG